MRVIWVVIVLLLTGSAQAKMLQKGRVTMSGEIVASACSIATDDVWQEVNFGTLPLKEIMKDKTPTKSFTIHLINCVLDKEHGGEWKSVRITFDGPVDNTSPALFAMNGEGKGVGVIISDRQGNKAIAGQHMPAVEINKGTTDLNYNLSLVRNGETLAVGDVTTFLRFMVAYQ